MPYRYTILWSFVLSALNTTVHGQTKPPATGPNPSTYVETMPVFPGLEPGDSARSNNQRIVKFINDSLRFPPQALRDGVQGRVFFSFTVSAQGRTADIKLVRGVRADIDAEALRNAHRLDRIRWRPGTQNGRPVSVSFTVPISFNISKPGRALGTVLPPDSLDLGPYQKLALPLLDWNGDRPQIPAGKGLVYGSCLQRLGGSGSFGTGEYVRLVNLTTGKAFSLNVKPALNSRRENAFCYALPAGRYALFLYAYPDPVWGGYKMHFENLRKSSSGNSTAAIDLHTTRFQFIAEAGKLHYVGVWNLANADEPTFLDEKTILDGRMQANYERLRFAEAAAAVPK